MKTLTTLLLSSLLILTSGCSLFQQPTRPTAETTQEDWPDYQQRMAASDHWQLNGKIGIRTASESNSAGIDWQQDGTQYQITLSGPFNAQAARISGNERRVRLEADGEYWTAATPEALLQRQLGWSLPLQELVWWVRGLPAPGSAHQQTLRAERLSTLKQKGWTIRYDRYSADGRHPEKLRLQYNNLNVILVIHQWQFL